MKTRRLFALLAAALIVLAEIAIVGSGHDDLAAREPAEGAMVVRDSGPSGSP